MPSFDPSCIDVEDFLECLEIRNVTKATEKEFRFSCPYPAHDLGDETPSCYMNAETTSFFCHSCHAKGNAISFAADVLKVSPIESTRLLRERYSSAGIDPEARNMVEEVRKILDRKSPPKRINAILDEYALDQYVVDWDRALESEEPWAMYMWARGFDAAVLRKWQFGYSERSQRITLPVRDEEGRLVGIKARAFDGRKPKYLNLREGEIEPFLKNEIVFALDRVIKAQLRDLIVVEGEFNAIAMHSYGWTNAVAINGSYFGKRQMRLIKRYGDEATLFFDSDTAGRNATEAVAAELSPFMPVYICPDHYGDPAEMKPMEIKACLADRKSVVERRLALMRS